MDTRVDQLVARLVVLLLKVAPAARDLNCVIPKSLLTYWKTPIRKSAYKYKLKEIIIYINITFSRL